MIWAQRGWAEAEAEVVHTLHQRSKVEVLAAAYL